MSLVSSNVFPTGTEAREGARGNLTILREIRDIEERILIAIAAEDFILEITDTFFTAEGSNMPKDGTADSRDYWSAWKKVLNDENKSRRLNEQMDQVLEHFKDIGYAIWRANNSVTSEVTFLWHIEW